jgi:hypothetical protein
VIHIGTLDLAFQGLDPHYARLGMGGQILSLIRALHFPGIRHVRFSFTEPLSQSGPNLFVGTTEKGREGPIEPITYSSVGHWASGSWVAT